MRAGEHVMHATCQGVKASSVLTITRHASLVSYQMCWELTEEGTYF